MNGTLAGLLQACAETTYDSTSHLILADWLDDQGQSERAELIRIQCRLADWVPDWRERQTLIGRQDELITTHRSAWLGTLASFCERIEFVRGLCRIEVVGSHFTTPLFGLAFQNRQASALIEQVRILRTSALTRVATRPWLALIPSLSLAGLRLRGAGCEPLLNSTLTDRLVALDLSGMDFTPAELLSLLHSDLCPRLARLTLRNQVLQAGQVAPLLQALPRLRELDLAGNPCAEEQVQRLVPYLPPHHRMNSLGMEFVRVPAGQFRMGAHTEETEALSDEKPQHTVTVTRPFWLGRFAVTRDQYTQLMANRHQTGDSNLPVNDISADDAEQFCKTLSELPEEVAAGRSYRLPTEAEWEHACRAGTFTTFSFGDRPTAALVNSQPGYLDNEWDYYYRGSLSPVGTHPANGFGLHEMHGNIWEWCSDWYNSREYERGDVVDPQNDTPSLSRITRGGCYAAAGASCRSARRGTARPQDHTPYTGFRVVLVQREVPSP